MTLLDGLPLTPEEIDTAYQQTTAKAKVQLSSSRRWRFEVVGASFSLTPQPDLAATITAVEGEGWTLWDFKPIPDGYAVLFWRFPEE